MFVLLEIKFTTTTTDAIKAARGIQQVCWSPNAFVFETSQRPPTNVPGSDLVDVKQDVCMFSNTTAIVETWAPLLLKFDLMFRKRAFLHWYENAGMFKDEFIDARENMATLIEAYQDGLEGETHQLFRSI